MNKKTAFILLIILLTVFGVFFYLLINKQEQSGYKPLPSQTKFTDEDIINLVNSKITSPDSFFLDKDKKFLGAYGGVLYADQKIDDKNIFYCTDNIDDTKHYIDKFIEENSGGGLRGAEYVVSVINSNENNRFFEFKINKKEKRGSRNKNYQYRIFKCSYVNNLLHGRYGNPSLNENNISSLYIGTLNARPITAEIVKLFSESMWSTGGFNNGKKVLNSFTEKQNDFFRHTIYETNTGCLVQSDCCSTTIYKSNYMINEDSGKINFSRKNIRTVGHGSESCYNLKTTN